MELESLQLKYDEASDEMDGLTENISTLDDEVKELEKKNKAHYKKTTSLEDEVKTLTEENKDLAQKLAEKEATAKKESADKAKETASKSTTENKTTASAPTKGTSKASTSNSSTTKSTDNSTTTEAKQNCDIKGSVNGIYHKPGSTYYSRTKNVVQWFCSTDEAVEAGYRAPEK